MPSTCLIDRPGRRAVMAALLAWTPRMPRHKIVIDDTKPLATATGKPSLSADFRRAFGELNRTIADGIIQDIELGKDATAKSVRAS